MQSHKPFKSESRSQRWKKSEIRCMRSIWCTVEGLKIEGAVTEQGLTARHTQKPILWHQILRKEKLLSASLLARRQVSNVSAGPRVWGGFFKGFSTGSFWTMDPPIWKDSSTQGPVMSRSFGSVGKGSSEGFPSVTHEWCSQLLLIRGVNFVSGSCSKQDKTSFSWFCSYRATWQELQGHLGSESSPRMTISKETETSVLKLQGTEFC